MNTTSKLETKISNFFDFSKKKNLCFSNNFIDKENSNLKAFIFSILYFQSREHFQRKQYEHEKKTFFKNAQRKFNMTISHFQNDYYWSSWMYLLIEKIRIFQNNVKLIKNVKTKHESKRLILSNFIKQNFYKSWFILDENLTFNVSTQFRIDSSYFQNAKKKSIRWSKLLNCFNYSWF